MSRQRQTADALVAAFNTMDIPAIIALRSPTCRRHFLPASLKFPPQSNDAYEAQLRSLADIFANFTITVHDVIEDAAQRKIVMFVAATGDTPVGKYENEYVWKMEFDEPGERIVQWTEFVDVGMVRDFFPKLRGEMMAKAGPSE